MRTAEALCELSKTSAVDGDEEYELLIKSLQIRKDLLPEDSPEIAESLKFLGRHLAEECDDNKAALPFFQKALSIYESHDPESKDEDTISAMNDVACTMEELGRIMEAREMAERAYRQSFQWQGARHLETAAMSLNLGLLIADEFPCEVFDSIPLIRLSLQTAEVMEGRASDGAAETSRTLAKVLLQCIEMSEKYECERSHPFHPGERVTVIADVEANRQLAEGHGGWHDLMERCCGQTGVVLGVDSDGDVRVIFGGRGGEEGRRGFCWNPAALSAADTPSDDTDQDQGLSRTVTARSRATGSRSDWPPKLSTIVDKQGLNEEEAKEAIRQEAETLLVFALEILEPDVDSASTARKCAQLLHSLYVHQGRKKEAKSMQKRSDALRAWASSSEEDSESSDDSDSDDDSDQEDSDDSDGSDASGGSDRSWEEVQDKILAVMPGFHRALQDDNDELMSVDDVQACLDMLARINENEPAQGLEQLRDREQTERSLKKMLQIAERRDRAASLLSGGWNSLVEEGTPTPVPRAASPGPAAALPGHAEPEPEIAEGVPPAAGTPPRAARDLHDDFDALSLAVQSASPPEHPYGRASTTGAAATEDVAARDSHEDLAALALAVQEASPPSHPFGRTATTRQ